ncbi:MAG: hypothetical protein JSV45_09650 [Chromatiales bacterium]|nr:MAG: hypothetical protein JSV45_09650 [Chromatiales bacterium]
MNAGPARILANLLLLAVVFSGWEAAFVAPAHADHGAAHSHQAGSDDPEDAEHSDHCCHMAGHLVGAVADTGLRPVDARAAISSQRHTLRIGSRAPPPVPPPTA